MGAKNFKLTVEGNVITPGIVSWNNDFLRLNFARLVMNPTAAQLQICKRNLEDRYGENMILNPFFMLLPKFLDGVPGDIPPLTTEQHIALYTEIVNRTGFLACRWNDEFNSEYKREIRI
jgi:hypothetical protein